MKSKINGVVLLVVWLSGVTVGAERENLVKNPSFEEDFEGWKTQKKLQTEAVEIEDSGYKGKCASIEQQDKEEYGAIIQKITAEPDKIYKWEVMIKGENIQNKPILFAIACYDSSNKWLSNLCAVQKEGTFDWTRFNGKGRTPEGIAYLEVKCVNRYGTGKVYFDEVKLMELEKEKGIDPEKQKISEKEGIIADFNFNSGKGNILFDDSGYGLNGIIYGAEWVKMDNGYGLKFDGEDDYILVEKKKALNKIEKEFSLAVWIKPEDIKDSNGRIITIEGWGDIHISKPVNNLSGFGFAFDNYFDATSPILSQDNFCFLVFTHDHQAKRIWVNGKLVLNVYSQVYGIWPKMGNIYIGSSSNLDIKRYFKGVMTEMRIYNRVMNEDEIEKEFKKKKDKYEIKDVEFTSIKSSHITIPTPYLSPEEVKMIKMNEQRTKYIIYKEGNFIYAKNENTGNIDFKDEDSEKVIQRAIFSLKKGGEIFLKEGEYFLNNTLFLTGKDIVFNGVKGNGELKDLSIDEIIHRDKKIEDMWRTKLIAKSSHPDHLLLIKGENIKVENLYFDGKWLERNQLARRNIRAWYCKNLQMKNICSVDAGAWNTDIRGCDNVSIKDFYVYSRGGKYRDGLDITDSRNVTIDGLYGRSEDDFLAIHAINDDCESYTIKNLKGGGDAFFIDFDAGSSGGSYPQAIRNITIKNLYAKNLGEYRKEATMMIHSGFIGFRCGYRQGSVGSPICENIKISNALCDTIFGENASERTAAGIVFECETNKEIPFQNSVIHRNIEIEATIISPARYGVIFQEGHIFEGIDLNLTIKNSGFEGILLKGSKETVAKNIRIKGEIIDPKKSGVRFENFNKEEVKLELDIKGVKEPYLTIE